MRMENKNLKLFILGMMGKNKKKTKMDNSTYFIHIFGNKNY